MQEEIEPYKTALSRLFSEFLHPKYADFVKKELELFISNEKEKIGFQSESDVIVVKITGTTVKIEFDYWDEKKEKYIEGEKEISFDIFLEELKKATEIDVVR